jgi:hypothetical protein
MPSADAPSLAVAAIAAKACLPRPRHIGRTASGAAFRVCRSLSGPVDREASSFASVIGAPRAPYHSADSGAPRPQLTTSRPSGRRLTIHKRPDICRKCAHRRTIASAPETLQPGRSDWRHLNHADRRGPTPSRTIAFAPAGPRRRRRPRLRNATHAITLPRAARRSDSGPAARAPGYQKATRLPFNPRRWRARGGRSR